MRKRTPIVINVPHASTFIPEEERQYFVTDRIDRELLVMTDHYCDDLFDVGYEMVRFPVSRLVCDFERFRDDRQEPMVAKGMGACYVSCSDQSMLRILSEAHKEELLQKYYDTYHTVLTLAVEERLGQFGRCLIIDGHSFYEEPLPYEYDQNTDRADICIGTDEYHTPPELISCMYSFFKKHGYSVVINTPFSGTMVPLKFYHADRRVQSVMIEINRRLYIDRRGRRTAGYETVKQTIQEMLSGLY